jgi:unsaturated rhamnogalacturonyl hydrolase
MLSMARTCVRTIVVVLALAAPAFAQSTNSTNIPMSSGQRPGQADPTFRSPSLAVGVDYTVPSPDEIKIVLDRMYEYFVRSTPYRVINRETGDTITDFATPIKEATIDARTGEFNLWAYSIGVSLAGMIQVSEVTGDPRFQEYALKNFDFIANHFDYFQRQFKAFGPQPNGLGRLFAMRELDDCGAIGAALVKAYAKKQDPRYKAIIDLVDDFISNKMSRMPDRTIARTRPFPVSIWVDDFYMCVPFLAQMGKLTGNPKYFDDAAQQVIGMSARLFNKEKGLYDHSWFADMEPDPHFYWGRGAGWALMATAELLDVLPENHPRRAEVLAIFQRAAQGAVEVQGGLGLWHQLLDKPDSYLETSVSAMFTYALARGVNKGWLPASYAPAAQAGWRALEQRVRADGMVEGICVGTTAAQDLVYYYSRPTDLAAPQGYGAMYMAGVEVMTMVKSFDISRTNNTFYYRTKK